MKIELTIKELRDLLSEDKSEAVSAIQSEEEAFAPLFYRDRVEVKDLLHHIILENMPPTELPQREKTVDRIVEFLYNENINRR